MSQHSPPLTFDRAMELEGLKRCACCRCLVKKEAIAWSAAHGNGVCASCISLTRAAHREAARTSADRRMVGSARRALARDPGASLQETFDQWRKEEAARERGARRHPLLGCAIAAGVTFAVCWLLLGAIAIYASGPNQRPSTINHQPTTNNQQPTTNNQQPTTNNQQPAGAP